MTLRNQLQHTRTGNKANQKITEHGRNVEFTAINYRNDGNEEDDNDGGEGKSFVHRAGGLDVCWEMTVLFMTGRPSGRGITFRHCRDGAEVLYQKTL